MFCNDLFDWLGGRTGSIGSAVAPSAVVSSAPLERRAVFLVDLMV